MSSVSFFKLLPVSKDSIHSFKKKKRIKNFSVFWTDQIFMVKVGWKKNWQTQHFTSFASVLTLNSSLPLAIFSKLSKLRCSWQHTWTFSLILPIRRDYRLGQRHTPSCPVSRSSSSHVTVQTKTGKYHWSLGGQSAASWTKSWNWNTVGRERSGRRLERRGLTRFSVVPEGTLTRCMEPYVIEPVTSEETRWAEVRESTWGNRWATQFKVYYESWTLAF